MTFYKIVAMGLFALLIGLIVGYTYGQVTYEPKIIYEPNQTIIKYMEKPTGLAYPEEVAPNGGGGASSVYATNEGGWGVSSGNTLNITNVYEEDLLSIRDGGGHAGMEHINICEEKYYDTD